MKQPNLENKQPIRKDTVKFEIRNAIDSLYDAQKLRIQTSNRLYAILSNSELENEEDIDVSVINKSLEEYKQINDIQCKAQAEALGFDYRDKLMSQYVGEYFSKFKSEDVIQEYLDINKGKNISCKYITSDEIYNAVDTYYKDNEKLELDFLLNKRKRPKIPRIQSVISKVDNLTYITSKSRYELVDVFNKLREMEEKYSSILKDLVESHPMWDLFFKDVKGCGYTMAGVCIAYLDVHKARHVSSFWSYAGVGTRVTETGERIAMSKKVTVDVEYVDKDGEIKTKKSIGYNTELHDKLLGVLVGSFLKTKTGSIYRDCYYEYKQRYSNREDLKDANAMRIHRMASRQCIKAFLRDLWVVWRKYEGYDISQPYEVEYLGRAPHRYNEYHSRKATV